MVRRISRNSWIAIVVITVIVIGGGAISINHTMQANHQKKIAADKRKAEKKNAEALANHVVVNGDTVQSVAKKFKENTDYMKKKFNLNGDDQLIQGTKIVDQRVVIDKKKQEDASVASNASQALVQSQTIPQTSNNPTSGPGTSSYQVPSSTYQAPSSSSSNTTVPVPGQGSNAAPSGKTDVDSWKNMNPIQAYQNLAG